MKELRDPKDCVAADDDMLIPSTTHEWMIHQTLFLMSEVPLYLRV